MENLELKMKKLFEKWKQEHKDDKLYEKFIMLQKYYHKPALQMEKSMT